MKIAPKSIWFALAVPLLASASIWPLYYAMFWHATGSDLEGAMFAVAFLNMGVYAIAGPIAVVTLGAVMRVRGLSLAAFCGLLLLVTSPIWAFQGVAYGDSVMSFLLHGPVTSSSVREFTIEATALAAGIYGAGALILYPFAKKHIAGLFA